MTHKSIYEVEYLIVYILTEFITYGREIFIIEEYVCTLGRKNYIQEQLKNAICAY